MRVSKVGICRKGGQHRTSAPQGGARPTLVETTIRKRGSHRLARAQLRIAFQGCEFQRFVQAQDERPPGSGEGIRRYHITQLIPAFRFNTRNVACRIGIHVELQLGRAIVGYPERVEPASLVWEDVSVRQNHLASLDGKLRLFVLPPYSRERNPDEQVWNHVKHHGVAKAAAQRDR